ncbi:MAG: sugar phosphate isomerase/epimerase family protein [Planctomycetota bacterium]
MPEVIGVNLDDMGVDTKTALSHASRLAVNAVEMATVAGDVAAWKLTSSGRRHLARMASHLGLRIESLVADMPGMRWVDPGVVDERVERTMQVIQLARDMDVPHVSSSLGAIKDESDSDFSPMALDALRKVADFAESRGVGFCVRPSYGGGSTLKALLSELDFSSVKVCLDPAAMVITGNNPLGSFDAWAERVAVFHARDGMAGNLERLGHEVRLGEGEVDLTGTLHALREAEYRGAYVLRRQESPSALADLSDAKAMLTDLLADSE